MNSFPSSAAVSEAGGFIPGDTHIHSAHLPLSEIALSIELPEQRHKPLRAGSKKEWDTIRWIEARMMSLNRKHAKRFEPGKQWEATDSKAQGQSQTSSIPRQPGDDEPGYASVSELATDVEQIIHVLWVCGTPSIQIPQMISLASFVETGLPAYPFQPEPTFRLLATFDVVFASFLTARNVLTRQPLSGCVPEQTEDIEEDPLDDELMLSYVKKPEPQSKVSATEKVRIKIIAESTRMTVLDIQAGRRREGLTQSLEPHGLPDMSAESEITSGPATDVDDTDGVDDAMEDDSDDDETMDGPGIRGGLNRHQLEAAKVYEMTIYLLGDDLGGEMVLE
ncbi:ADP/ATP carrier protein [Ascosphaera pollenicola]|nr:ADP/ATP carrier protein [Ascosphaera pollenicola]